MGSGATPEAIESHAPSPPEALAGMLAGDLAAVDRLIHERFASPVGLIPDLARYLIDAGGKRVRPIVTLASAQCLGACGPSAHRLAAAVEFIHTATLLHDDVVDESGLRRGKASAHRVWGNAASVLVGDFLFARSFTLMVETGDIEILGVLAHASSVIAEGEVLQLSAANDADASLDQYMRIIAAKTAALFAAAAKAGALSAGADPATASSFDAYGRNLGLAFQLVDDALDYGGAAQIMGKNVGDDFRERKLTMPVIVARDEGDETERAFWRRVISDGEQRPEDFDAALSLLRRRGAIAQTLDLARTYAQAAREALSAAPNNVWRRSLEDLAEFVVSRAA